MRFVLLVTVAGCLHYDAGSFRDFHAWRGTRVALGCLDVALDVARDDQATGPVVQYTFGNRCDHDVVVDIPAVRVVARDALGRELRLAAFDPRHEIRAAALPARLSGSERIEYNGDFAERDLAQVCVDVGALDRSAPAERWLCNGSRLEASR